MLQFRKQKSLAAQAMHELGNIMFHNGNIRFVHAHFLRSYGGAVAKLVQSTPDRVVQVPARKRFYSCSSSLLPYV